MMDPATTTKERLQSRDFEAIEDEWLARLDEDPTQTPYFVAVARVLMDNEQAETVRPLLRLLDEELEGASALEQRLELLLEAGHIYLRPNSLHEAVVAALEEIYATSDSLDDMLRIADMHRSAPDRRTLLGRVARFRAMMLLDVGSVVHMEGKGVGVITEINFDLGRYKVDFERIKALTVGFKAGAKLLEPLPENHVLRRKLESPAELETLRDDSPSELLREVLNSYPDPLTAAQIKAALDGIVTAAGWQRWWTAARKNPQVLVTSDKRQRYHWAASSDAAAEALWDAFDEADLDDQLEIFNKNARQNPELAERMGIRLAADAETLVNDGEPARALEVWSALARSGLADRESAFSPASIASSSPDIAALAKQLSQRRQREELYTAAVEERQDWVDQLTACVLVEDDPVLVGRLAERIGEHDAERLEQLVDRSLSRAQDHPGAFIWVAQRADDDSDLRRRQALRLFRQLLAAPGRSEFASYRASLEPLLESGGTLPKLVADLDEEDAEAAAAAVGRSSLEDYLKIPLVNALELRFESLRSETDDVLYATPGAIDKQREEARLLHEVEIPTNRQAIQEAAALGDLRENFEYKSARQRHEYLSARLAKLQEELSRVRPIDFAHLETDRVRIGSTVELDGAGGRRRITLLGPWESDPDEGLISYQSDLGKALLESEPGDTVELEDGTYEIAGIDRYEAG